ncbi:MAG: Arc family DNA-binding protein [Alphaproteobacteria bacterium]
MAQLSIRDLDDAVVEKLRRRATRHGRSLDADVSAILQEAVLNEVGDAVGLGSRIAARFAGLGLDHDLPELRGSTVRPMKVDTRSSHTPRRKYQSSED